LPWRQTGWRLSSWTPPYPFLRWCRRRCPIGGRTSAPASRGCPQRVRSSALRSFRGRRCGCSLGSGAFRTGIGTTCRTCFKFKWNDNGNMRDLLWGSLVVRDEILFVCDCRWHSKVLVALCAIEPVFHSGLSRHFDCQFVL
jgi:hypothetical protein